MNWKRTNTPQDERFKVPLTHSCEKEFYTFKRVCISGRENIEKMEATCYIINCLDMYVASATICSVLSRRLSDEYCNVTPRLARIINSMLESTITTLISSSITHVLAMIISSLLANITSPLLNNTSLDLCQYNNYSVSQNFEFC